MMLEQFGKDLDLQMMDISIPFIIKEKTCWLSVTFGCHMLRIHDWNKIASRFIRTNWEKTCFNIFKTHFDSLWIAPHSLKHKTLYFINIQLTNPLNSSQKKAAKFFLRAIK